MELADHLVKSSRALCPFNLLGKDRGNELDLTPPAASGQALKEGTLTEGNYTRFSLRSQLSLKNCTLPLIERMCLQSPWEAYNTVVV